MPFRRRKNRLNRTAETIGRGLGHLAARYDAWMKQRDELASEIHEYVTTGQKMLADLGRTADRRIRRTRKKSAQVRKKIKRTFSPAARAKLRAAAKARWAAAKKAGKARLG